MGFFQGMLQSEMNEAQDHHKSTDSLQLKLPFDSTPIMGQAATWLSDCSLDTTTLNETAELPVFDNPNCSRESLIPIDISHLTAEIDNISLLSTEPKEVEIPVYAQFRQTLSSSINITGAFTDSNTITPPTKELSFDVSPEYIKRSFSRLKQTCELLNTERVYLCALKILKDVYIDNFMAEVSTPLCFENFERCISKLIDNHTQLYNKIQIAYKDWSNDALNFESNSPEFKHFEVIPPEKERHHLRVIVDLLIKESIDVKTYGEYCSLFNKIISFTAVNNIDKYKRNSLVILNDYIVKYRNLEKDFFIDQRLDTRFISVVQMPTNRITRYNLMMSSLLKHIEDDEQDAELVKYYKNGASKLVDLVDNVNHYVGESNKSYQQLDIFKAKFSSNLSDPMVDPLFFDNLSLLKFSGALGVVYHDDEKSKLSNEHMMASVFENHLILAKPTTGKAEIKFIIPFLSIINKNDILGNQMIFDNSPQLTLSTQYEPTLNFVFENNFQIHELALLFPTLSEMNLWIDIFKNVLINQSHQFSLNWEYSEKQQRVNALDLGSENERFKLSCMVPSDISPIKSKSKNSLYNSVHSFEVESWDTQIENFEFSTPYSNSRNNRSTSTTSSPKTPGSFKRIKKSFSKSSNLMNTLPIVKLSLLDRVAVQNSLGDLWSPVLIKYQLNTLKSISRSFSMFFNKDDAADFGRSLKASGSLASLSSFVNPPSSSMHDDSSMRSSTNLLGSPLRLKKPTSVKPEIRFLNAQPFSIPSKIPDTPTTPITPVQHKNIQSPLLERSISRSSMSTTRRSMRSVMKSPKSDLHSVIEDRVIDTPMRIKRSRPNKEQEEYTGRSFNLFWKNKESSQKPLQPPIKNIKKSQSLASIRSDVHSIDSKASGKSNFSIFLNRIKFNRG
ncbi:hypothetical protein DAMA08_028640 [Martiniozyma asiatica (nom. inval.)]|nr:hypothetical protein DAMA08_028640 [Martiniozyma asiatica]